MPPKIIGYGLVIEADKSRFIEYILDALRKGYQPYGPMMTGPSESGLAFIQPMVKYEENG